MSESRRSWITLGEVIALLALIVSAVGVWIAWKSSDKDKTTRVVEQRQPIPLTLRGSIADEGRTLTIQPVEQSHALQSLTLAIKGTSPIQISGDGQLNASEVQAALKERDEAKGPHSIPVGIEARYVEMGKDKTTRATYTLRYRWDGGGLFGGRSLRLTGFGR
jgi:hypothetical protein